VLDALEPRGIRLPVDLSRDLSLQARSGAVHVAHSVIGMVVGLLAMLIGGAALGLAVPALGGVPVVWAGLLGAIVGGLLPTIRVVSRAGDLRRDFRHVVGSFLDLVAMNLAGGRGVPEALQSAAGVSDSWAMLRIRETLETARLQGITAWAALGTLGSDTGVDELRDLSAALALVADDGAKVRQSLSARATSLRRRQLADTEGRAQARSQSMLVAQLFLALGFLIFLIYPAIDRILSG
jgi:Flp pilus assembly protein TadB